MSFSHGGKQVKARVVRTAWQGGDKMRYHWETEDGRKIETQGVPKGAVEVAAKPAKPAKRTGANSGYNSKKHSKCADKFGNDPKIRDAGKFCHWLRMRAGGLRSGKAESREKDQEMSLFDRLMRGSALTEGAIGGRIAGARRAYTLPPPTSGTAGQRDMTPELIKKRKRELAQRQEVRERLRILAIESRRPLKTLGEARGLSVGARFKFPNEVGKLAVSAWEISDLGGPGGKVIFYRVGKGGKTLSAMQPGKNLTGVPVARFRKMVQAGDAVAV